MLVQLMEQMLYRNPGYCTEMRNYLGTLQQTNLLSLDVYATLIAEIEQFEEKHLSITFEHWRTHPENTVFHKHPLPPPLPPSLPKKRGYLAVGGVLSVVMIGFIAWYGLPITNVTPDIQSVMPTTSDLPSPATPPAAAPSNSSTLLAQSVTPAAIEQPLPPPPAAETTNTISTGDVEPALPELAPLQIEAIHNLLKTCQTHFAARRLTTGKGGSAVACYRQVLTLDANNVAAKEGLAAVEKIYGDWAENMLKRKQRQKAQQYAHILAEVNPDSPILAELQQKLSAAR